jgi:(E)-4-hydroxy-3-methylbut-2-enyl-diphosphate synthase
MEAAKAFGAIRGMVTVPLVADIHFDHTLAIESIRRGADKIRINPGNIGNPDQVGAVVTVAKEHNIQSGRRQRWP